MFAERSHCSRPGRASAFSSGSAFALMTPRRSARTVAPGPIKTRGGAMTSQVDGEVEEFLARQNGAEDAFDPRSAPMTETGARPLVRRP